MSSVQSQGFLWQMLGLARIPVSPLPRSSWRSVLPPQQATVQHELNSIHASVLGRKTILKKILANVQKKAVAQASETPAHANG
jgi:hypothetical protein